MSDHFVDHEARAEDIRWFVETGENLVGAARRLGIGTEGVEAWCKKHGMRAEMVILRSRNPYNHNDERARLGAAARWAS